MNPPDIKNHSLSYFRFGDGRLLEQCANEKGLNRPDGPALIEYDADGRVIVEEFWQNGVRIARSPAKPSKKSVTRSGRPTP